MAEIKPEDEFKDYEMVYHEEDGILSLKDLKHRVVISMELGQVKAMLNWYCKQFNRTVI